MSLVPMLFSNWWEDLDRPHRLHDQLFGVGLHPYEMFVEPRRQHPQLNLYPTYYRPWSNLLANVDKGTSTVKADKNKFEVNLDVQQFKPDEIDVKVVDKYVVVSGKHEEKQDEHGWISREFTRKYMIPEQCNIDEVKSQLSTDGVLTITVPRKEQPKLENEKTIKIEHTGKPALKCSDTAKTETK